MSRCWHCDRAVPDHAGTRYVFGVVCNRKGCARLKSALSPRFQTFWFTACLPGPDSLGRSGSFTTEGDPNWPRGITESSLQTNIDSKRQARESVQA